MRRAVLAGLLLLAVAGPARAVVALEPVGSFSEPTYVTAPPGDAARLFVVERAGTIRLVRAGQPRVTFLDLTALVTQPSGSGEGGLLSMAFAPDHAVSGRLYVYYTDRSGDQDIHVREFRVATDSVDRADLASGREVLQIPHPDNQNHVGGQLAFGPDGYLYVGVGDGGGADDLPNNAQNPARLLGKLLRIDPRGTGSGEHTVPADNPGFAAPQVYALGLRNPWRFSFDRLTGALVIGDVGQGRWEEVDWFAAAQARGANLGWRRWEGLVELHPETPAPNPAFPIHVYEHVAGACSITGGFVVRDVSVPSLAGRYVYADYCAGWIRSLDPDGPTLDDRLLPGLEGEGRISFGEDGLCRVYVVGQGGDVSRLVERGAELAPGCPAAAPAPPGTTPGPEPVATAAAAPAPLTVGVRGAAVQRLGLVLARGFAARCRVSEPARCVVTATIASKAARALGLRRDGRTAPLTFARGTIALAAPGERPLRLRLSPAARRVLLRRATRFRVAVRLHAEAIGAGGRRDAGSTTIVLERR